MYNELHTAMCEEDWTCTQSANVSMKNCEYYEDKKKITKPKVHIIIYIYTTLYIHNKDFYPLYKNVQIFSICRALLEVICASFFGTSSCVILVDIY